MYLKEAYGPTLPAALFFLLMYFSMVIARSFLTRTFGSHTLQLFEIDDSSLLVPVLIVGLLLTAFLINLSGNSKIQGISTVLGFIKIGGIVLFGMVGVLAADSVKGDFSAADPGASVTGFIGATALGILAFKGFTTITGSGSELKDPSRNLGKAIMISIALCVVIYASFVPGPRIRTDDRSDQLWRTVEPVTGGRRGVDPDGRGAFCDRLTVWSCEAAETWKRRP